MADHDLVEVIEVTQELQCYVRRSPGLGVRAHIVPINPRVFWQRHRDIDLTEGELERILEAVRRAKEAP